MYLDSDDDNDDTISHDSNDDGDMTLRSSYNTTSQASSSISVPSAHPIKDVKEKVVRTSKANSSNLDDNSPVLGSGTNLVADSNKASASGSSIKNTQENKENSTDELGGNGNINGTGVKEGPFINGSNVQQGGSTQEINKVRSPLGQINNIQNNSRSNGNVMKIARIFDTSIFYGYLPPK
jgi:hypothetical protein